MFHSIAREAYQKFKHSNYHKAHQTNARSALSIIESEQGKLSPKLKNRAAEYANDVLGWRGYAPWLDVYSAIAGEFKEGWIPDNYYGHVVIPVIKGSYGTISNAKSLSARLLKTDRFPDAGYFVNGLFLSAAGAVIPPHKIKDYIFCNDDRIVFKSDHSVQGKNIYFYDKENFCLETINKLGNGVFQKYINQHPFFDEIMSGSVATLRVTSVALDNGEISCRAAFLRIGLTHDTHIKWASNVIIPVEMASGRLQKKAYLPDWRSVTRHPETGYQWEGKVIPRYDEVRKYVMETHKAFPFCRCIGWDLIVDKNDEIQVMEWNGEHNDIKFHEAISGPCFAEMGWENLWRHRS